MWAMRIAECHFPYFSFCILSECNTDCVACNMVPFWSAIISLIFTSTSTRFCSMVSIHRTSGQEKCLSCKTLTLEATRSNWLCPMMYCQFVSVIKWLWVNKLSRIHVTYSITVCICPDDKLGQLRDFPWSLLPMVVIKTGAYLVIPLSHPLFLTQL